MLKGIMYHKQLEDYFRFLGLEGLACQQYDRFMSESAAYSRLCRFHLKTMNKLMRQEAPEYESIIPESWYKHKRQDVDDSTRREGVRAAFSIWTTWEKETLAEYERMAAQLRAEGKERCALYFDEFVREVAEELETAERMWLELMTANYDPVFMLSMKGEPLW